MDIKNITQTNVTRFSWAFRADLALIFIGQALLLLLIVFDESIWFLSLLRLILGTLSLLFIPGYCLSLIFFPQKDDLTAVERLAISIGLSLSVASLLALILNVLPWGLVPWVIILGYAVTILLLVGVAWWRCSTLSSDTVFFPEMTLPPFQHPLNVLLARPISWALSGGIFFILFATTWVFVFPAPEDFLTEFYILGEEGRPENFPRESHVGEELDVTVGVVNQEQTPQTYYIEVWVTWAWDPEEWETQVQVIEPFTLEVGESLEQTVTWRMPWEVDDALVRFWLFRQGDTEPYRELKLWMNVFEEDDSLSNRSESAPDVP